jgi:TATA-binding protein-associated factor
MIEYILGIKYTLIVRQDDFGIILPLVIQDILQGLLDTVDDVSSVSASTLVPIASHLPNYLSHEQVSHILKILWDLLLNHDDLAAACNSYMTAMAAILSLPNASQWIKMEPMAVLIPRMWPFLSHPSSSVRRSTLQTLKKLTEVPVVELDMHFGVQSWPANLLQDALRHIYLRVLVEHVEDIQNLVEIVWKNIVQNANITTLLHASCPFVSCFMCLAMQPPRLAFAPNLLIASRADGSELSSQKLFLGGAETIPTEIRLKNVIRSRFKASKMLGILSKFLVLPAPGVVYSPSSESPLDSYCKLLLGYLNSRSSLQRFIASLIIAFWAEAVPEIKVSEELQEKLKTSLNEYIYYDEIVSMVTRLQQESSDFLATLKQHKITFPSYDTQILTLDQIKELCTTLTENIKTKYNLKNKVATLLEDRRKSLLNSYTTISTEQQKLNIITQSALASAAVRLKSLPEKLNPIVKPLMESIKREENSILQKLSAESLTFLISQVCDRQPSPNVKIINNLTTLLRSDESFTPKLEFSNLTMANCKPGSNNPFYGIITLENQNTKLKDAANTASRGPGRPSNLEIAGMEVDAVSSTTDSNGNDENVSLYIISKNIFTMTNLLFFCRLAKRKKFNETVQCLHSKVYVAFLMHHCVIKCLHFGI